MGNKFTEKGKEQRDIKRKNHLEGKKAIEAQLKQLASVLPIVKLECYDKESTAVPVSVKIKGSEVLNHGKITKTKEGDEIKPNKTYIVDLPNHFAIVNHERRLNDAYKKGGWDAVNLYIEGIKKKFASTAPTMKVEETPKEDTKEATGNNNA